MIVLVCHINMLKIWGNISSSQRRGRTKQLPSILDGIGEATHCQTVLDGGEEDEQKQLRLHDNCYFISEFKRIN